MGNSRYSVVTYPSANKFSTRGSGREGKCAYNWEKGLSEPGKGSRGIPTHIGALSGKKPSRSNLKEGVRAVGINKNFTRSVMGGGYY